jgi:hypothetical protein
MISGFCCSCVIQKRDETAFSDIHRGLCIDRSGDSAQVGEEVSDYRLDANDGKNLHRHCTNINKYQCMHKDEAEKLTLLVTYSFIDHVFISIPLLFAYFCMFACFFIY